MQNTTKTEIAVAYIQPDGRENMQLERYANIAEAEADLRAWEKVMERYNAAPPRPYKLYEVETVETYREIIR